jgi:formate dehydrogenase
VEVTVEDNRVIRTSVTVFSAVGAIELTATVDDRPRRGALVVDHGWGSRIFDPRGGSTPESCGANRNLQTAALSSSYVGIEGV